MDIHDTEYLLKTCKYVSINQQAIESFLSHDFTPVSSSWTWGDCLPLEQYIRLIIVFNSINYCYWPMPGTQKWTVTVNGQTYTGSTALWRLLEAQAYQNPDFLTPDFISKLRSSEFSKLTNGNISIPLADQRVLDLHGLCGLTKLIYAGDFLNIFKSGRNDAQYLLTALTNHFPGYKDVANFRDAQIPFHKRAQLAVKMIDDCLVFAGKKPLDNIHILTAFADYKVPQILRHFDILSYLPMLAKLIDNNICLPPGSIVETEIRLSTIWAVEYIKRHLNASFPDITAADIDNFLWEKSHHIGDLKPHHRIITSAY